MTHFKVDLDELAHVIESLDSFGQTLAGKLAELEEVVKSLRAEWRGDAADAQVVVHRQLAAGANDMHTALVDLHAVARNAHANYSGAVAANQQMWRQIR